MDHQKSFYYPILMDRLEKSSSETSSSTRGKFAKKIAWLLYAKRYSLTFYNCSCSLDVAMSRLIQMSSPPQVIVCSTVNRKDGSYDMFIFLQFETNRKFLKSDCFDFVCQGPGHYRVCSDRLKCLKYITQGGNYLLSGIDEIQLGFLKSAKS